MIDSKQFEIADAVDIYTRMRPDQRTAIANEFARELTLAGDPNVGALLREGADTVAQKAGDVARGAFTPAPPQMLSPQEVAQIHSYARDRRHDVFEQVLRHPVTQAALAHPGEAPSGGDGGLEAADVRPEVDVPSPLEKAAMDPFVRP